MKVKLFIIACLSLVIAAVAFNAGSVTAKSSAITPPKVGVLNLMKVINDCDIAEEMDKKSIERRKQINEEITKLQDEVVSLEIDTKTSKPGSDDYLEKIQELFQKRAIVDAKQQYYQQEVTLKEQRAFEKVYQQVVETAQEVAKERGLDLVLAKSDNEFPLANVNDLSMIMMTTKIYYNSEDIDITADVIEKMNQKGTN